MQRIGCDVVSRASAPRLQPPANETIVACNYLNLMRQPPTAYSEEIGVDLGSVKAQP